MKTGNKGFTLIELIVALSIASIFFLCIFTFYNYQNKNYNDFLNDNIIDRNIDNAMKDITDDITSNNDATIKIDNNKVDILIKGVLVYHYDKNTQVLYKNGKLYAKNIDTFNVTKNSDNTIDIQIGNNKSSYSLKTSILLRH